MWRASHPRVERPEDRRVGQLPPPPRGSRPQPPRPAHEVPRGRGRCDGWLPPPQPDGHVPGAGHQHDGLEEHQSGMLPRGTLSMRGGANMGSPSSHLGIVDISTNTALGSDWHRGEMCSLNEPNSLEKMREMRRRKLLSGYCKPDSKNI